MAIIILYLLFCTIVALLADSTTLGFWGGFLISVFLTPFTGFIIMLFYPSKKHRDHQIALQQQILDEQRRANRSQSSAADELAKWKAQLDAGVISQSDFDLIKHKLLNDIR